jgi:hypothetical protein
MPMEPITTQKGSNRRRKTRFPIHRELRYKLLQDGRILEAGLGQTLNMGSGGVAFTLDRELPAGTFIELSISWPVQLDNGTPMRLVVFGRILRSGAGISACSVDKYEFRTQSRSPHLNTGLRGNVLPPRWAGLSNTKPHSKSAANSPAYEAGDRPRALAAVLSPVLTAQ